MKPYPLTRISRLLTILLLSSTASNMALAQQPQQFAFSVQESVEYAMKNSTQVKNALIGINLQEQTNREITAAAYPQISGSGNMVRNLQVPVGVLPGDLMPGGTPGTFITIPFGTKYNASYGASASQILFDGQVFVGLQARRASMDYARLNVEVTEEQIKANVQKIYYQLVVAKSQIATVDVNIERTKTLLNNTEQLYKNGFAERLDVDKVNVNLSNLNTEKVKLQNQIEAGYIGLKYLMGMPVQATLVLTDSLTEQQIKSNVIEEGEFDFNNRKEFQLLKMQEVLNEFNVKRYKYTYIPTLQFNANYTRNAFRTQFDLLKWGPQYPWYPTSFIGISINVPIFDGFGKDARIKRSRFELMQTRNNIEDTRNNINNEIETAKINIRSAIITMDEQKKNVELAERVYNQTKLKYEQGLGSNIEITTAEGDLKIAQNNYFSALYDAIVAKVDYLKATGKL
ncbi:MAG: TolC family protein [Chitinophagaceae bacterium]|nr:MAG: TolC family protein [Chitinophagaceae bacterium]